jgi:hypothetical protein
MAWIDDFERYVETAGTVADQVTKVTQAFNPDEDPYWWEGEQATTPKQAQEQQKPVQADATDAKAGFSSTAVLIGLGLLALLFLVN